ncbi:BrnT family toxin [Bdellovibrio sp. HCB290]|uniref:BrnT family toxin n=1 Tax=Bdellovibrio sp. HCB290 TaxID=3394356 RepID=UPI0039B6CFE1
MDLVEFEWDDAKATSNRRKHGVSFSEAATVWKDQWALEIADPDHSIYEDRGVRIGMIAGSKVLVVVFTESDPGLKVRIIYARRATQNEEQQYFARRV